jgi:hypothetical protein
MATRTLAEAAAGTAAARPAAAAGNAGDLYFSTDTGVLWRSTGSAWVRVVYDPAALYNGNIAYREPFPRWTAASNLTISSGVGNYIGIPLYAGDVVTNLSFLSGATALTMGSNADGHLWFALYDTGLSLLSQSADQGGAATWTGNTVKTLALSSPVTVTGTGLYYAAVMVNAGTGGSPAVPTLRGLGLGTGSSAVDSTGWPTGAKRITGTSGSGLGATAAAGPVALTVSVNALYCMTS